MLGSWVRGLPVHVFRTNHRETRVSVLGTASNQLRAAHVELVDGANEAFSGFSVAGVDEFRAETSIAS